jgi:AcrR family transcriptional regulator
MNTTRPIQSGGSEPKTPRPRDAAATKDALLQAAQVLFGQKGFERTTIRQIGELAGVDAALIARYFGNKADLYIAAVAEEDLDQRIPLSYNGMQQIADTVLTRADQRGPGPILQAMIRSDTSSEIRRAAQGRVTRRLVDPLAASMAKLHVDRPRLRSEIAISALFGISLGRSLGWFEDIRSVPKDELVALITETLGEVTGNTPDTR